MRREAGTAVHSRGAVTVKTVGVASKVGPLPAVLIACCLLLGFFMVIGAEMRRLQPGICRGLM